MDGCFCCRSVSGCSPSPCLQAAISYRRVFLAQTSLSVACLCDTGHIIILGRNKNVVCLCLLSAVSLWCWWLHQCTNTQKEKCAVAAVYLLPVWKKRGWVNDTSLALKMRCIIANTGRPEDSSSANMSEVTEIVSTGYREDTSVPGCGPRELLILHVLSDARVHVHLFAGCRPDKEREGRALDEVVQTTALLQDKHTADVFYLLRFTARWWH